MLSLPSAIIGELSARNADEQDIAITIAQATGILRTYMKLVDYKMENLAEYLAPTIEKCLSTIEEGCVLTESSLTINDKDTPVTALVALETGSALINYGNRNGSQEHITAGYAITNTALTQGTPDLITRSEVYPVITANRHYPHFVMLNREKNIWTWTAADLVSYTERGNTANLTMKHSVGSMHFQIISNLPNFKDINIYGLSYHSDARFEVYASSGYVYKESTKTLFLKTRHKSETEVIKFTF